MENPLKQSPKRISLSSELVTKIASGFTIRATKKKPGRLSKKMKAEEEAKIIGELHATINSVAELNDTDPTHILIPDDEFDDPFLFTPTSARDDECVDTRVVQIDGDKVKIHHYFKPDSEDEWIDKEEEQEYEDPPPPHEGVWRVGVRWLRDSIYYKTWMVTFLLIQNELDYIYIETPQSTPPPVKPKKKIKVSDDELSVESDGGDKKRRRVTRVVVVDSDSEESFKSKSEGSDLFVASDKDSGSAFEGESEDEEVSEEDAAVSEAGSEDTDVILRAGVRRRVSDDEDDGLMEPVPAYIIKQQEAPFELYPLIELVDLDKKIPPRMKKHEFEPLGQSGGVFKNISITRSSWRWVDTVEYVIPETLTWPTSLLGFKPRWFDFDAIHAYERAANPTFFLDPLAPPPDTDLPTVLASVRHPLKTPEFYSAFRNIVISYYLSTASHFMPLISTVPLLEAASRRVCNNESYSLDLSDIIGLYDFFTHAGLVNFSCTNFTRTGDCKTFEEVQAARTRRDIPLGPFAAQIWRESDVHPVKSTAYSYEAYNTRYKGSYPNLVTLCPNCFTAGHYPAHHPLFIRTHGPLTQPSNDWTAERTALLLQAMHDHEDNWRRVSDAVGVSVQECIVRFIQLDTSTQVHDSLPALLNHVSCALHSGISAAGARALLSIKKDFKKSDLNVESDDKSDLNVKSEVKQDLDIESEVKQDLDVKSEVKQDLNVKSEVKQDLNVKPNDKPDEKQIVVKAMQEEALLQASAESVLMRKYFFAALDGLFKGIEARLGVLGALTSIGVPRAAKKEGSAADKETRDKNTGDTDMADKEAAGKNDDDDDYDGNQADSEQD